MVPNVRKSKLLNLFKTYISIKLFPTFPRTALNIFLQEAASHFIKLDSVALMMPTFHSLHFIYKVSKLKTHSQTLIYAKYPYKSASHPQSIFKLYYCLTHLPLMSIWTWALGLEACNIQPWPT